jgi:hypothetical protein
MTTHLSPQESVNALDGVLPQNRQSHLDSCAACRTHVDDLRAMMTTVGEVEEVPEPSPLFWDHFQARVQTAVQAEMVRPAPAPWWAMIVSVRGAMAAAATVAVAMVAVALYPGDHVAPIAPVEDAQVAVADDAMALETAEWMFVSQIMGTLEQADVREVLAPSPRAVDNAFAALTSDERDAFVKLLTAEMAEGME